MLLSGGKRIYDNGQMDRAMLIEWLTRVRFPVG